MSSTPVPPSSERCSPSARLLEVIRDQVHRCNAVTPATAGRGGSPSPSLSVFAVDAVEVKLVQAVDTRVADALLGLEIGPAHDGIVAVADSVVTTRSSRFRSARLALGVWRDGTEECCVATGLDLIAPTEPRGWLIDACRRALGLRSAPTNLHPLELPLALWLDRLMVDIVQAATTPCWAAAASRCPVPSAWHHLAPAALGAHLAAITPSWSSLRASVAAGAPAAVPVAAEHAAWMDDAMFARWCTGFFPDLDELRSDIAFLAPPGVSDAVDAAIDASFRAFAEGR